MSEENTSIELKASTKTKLKRYKKYLGVRSIDRVINILLKFVSECRAKEELKDIADKQIPHRIKIPNRIKKEVVKR